MSVRAPVVLALLVATSIACSTQYHATVSKDFTVPQTVAVVAVVDAQNAEGSFLVAGMSKAFPFDEDLLSDKLTRYLVGQRLYSVVERASISQAIQELSLTTSELFDNREAQQKLGVLCKADHIVIARASMSSGWLVLPPIWWKYAVLEARAIDVESGRIMWAAHAGGWNYYVLSSDAHLERLVGDLFHELDEGIENVRAQEAAGG